MSTEDHGNDGNIFENPETVEVLENVKLIARGRSGLDAIRLALGNVNDSTAVNAGLVIAGEILSRLAAGDELQFVDVDKLVRLGPITFARSGARERVSITFRDGHTLGQDPI